MHHEDGSAKAWLMILVAFIAVFLLVLFTIPILVLSAFLGFFAKLMDMPGMVALTKALGWVGCGPIGSALGKAADAGSGLLGTLGKVFSPVKSGIKAVTGAVGGAIKGAAGKAGHLLGYVPGVGDELQFASNAVGNVTGGLVNAGGDVVASPITALAFAGDISKLGSKFLGEAKDLFCGLESQFNEFQRLGLEDPARAAWSCSNWPEILGPVNKDMCFDGSKDDKKEEIVPRWLRSIYTAAGLQYNVPWEVLAAVNWNDTEFGAKSIPDLGKTDRDQLPKVSKKDLADLDDVLKAKTKSDENQQGRSVTDRQKREAERLAEMLGTFAQWQIEDQKNKRRVGWIPMNEKEWNRFGSDWGSMAPDFTGNVYDTGVCPLPVASTGVALGGGFSSGATIDSPVSEGNAKLSENQIKFVDRLAAETGLDVNVIGAWVFNEMNGSHAQQRESEGYYNWLNIAHYDHGEGAITKDPIWRDPLKAAHVTAEFLKARRWNPGKGIPYIIKKAAGKSVDVQIQVISESGWATSLYRLNGGPPGSMLRNIYDNLPKRKQPAPIGDAGAGQATGNDLDYEEIQRSISFSPDGRADACDPVDSIFALARYLSANGVASSRWDEALAGLRINGEVVGATTTDVRRTDGASGAERNGSLASMLKPNGGTPLEIKTGLKAPPTCPGGKADLKALLPLWRGAARTFGVKWEIVAGITKQESNLGCNLSDSSAGAQGWTQFMPSTWAAYGVDADGSGKADPKNAVDAIYAAARYYRVQLNTFQNRQNLALASYNAGPGAVQRYNGVPPYGETRHYVTSVPKHARDIKKAMADNIDSSTPTQSANSKAGHQTLMSSALPQTVKVPKAFLEKNVPKLDELKKPNKDLPKRMLYRQDVAHDGYEAGSVPSFMSGLPGTGALPQDQCSGSRTPSQRMIDVFASAGKAFSVDWRILAAIAEGHSQFGCAYSGRTVGTLMRWDHNYSIESRGTREFNRRSFIDAAFSTARTLHAYGAEQDLPKALRTLYDKAPGDLLKVTQIMQTYGLRTEGIVDVDGGPVGYAVSQRDFTINKDLCKTEKTYQSCISALYLKIVKSYMPIQRCAAPERSNAVGGGNSEGFQAAVKIARDAPGRTVGFALASPDGTMIASSNPNAVVRSASITKAMLLVALTRSASQRALTSTESRHAASMIGSSTNDAANSIFKIVGASAVKDVANRAGMNNFKLVDRLQTPQGYRLGYSEVTAADQARFFAQVDRLIPSRHRSKAMNMLRRVTGAGVFGVLTAAKASSNVDVSASKGGWRPESEDNLWTVNQGAQVKINGQVYGFAVVSNGQATRAAGNANVEKIAAAALRGSKTDPSGASSEKFVKPTNGPISSPFGPRVSPTAGASSNHKGLDFGVPTGTKIFSVLDGTVVNAAALGGFGNFMCVQHNPKLTTCYAHLSAYKAKVGEKVKRGDVIALSGNTGVSTGPHLHFQVHIGKSWTDRAVDPAPYISGAKTPSDVTHDTSDSEEVEEVDCGDELSGTGEVGEKIAEIAKKHLGKSGVRAPKSSPTIKGFSPETFGDQWCSWFATNVWREAGVKIGVLPFTGNVYEWGKARGTLFKAIGNMPKGKTPPVGSALLYGTGISSTSASRHVNLVSEVKNDGSFMIIGGNESDSVKLSGPCRLTGTANDLRLQGPNCASSRPIYGIVQPTK